MSKVIGKSVYMKRSTLCLAIAAVAPLTPVQAQERAQEAMLEEVVVMARKRTENLQEVPDTVVALSADTLERSRVVHIRDVTSRVPNVSIEESLSPTSTFIGIRGVVSTRNGEPAVAMVVDGVQIASASEITQALFDVEQIEVLKGPQGALYGRNAIGGAVLITSKAPTDELTGRLTAGLGNAGLMEVNGSISGPITDSLRYRVSGNLRDFEGTIRNEYLAERIAGTGSPLISVDDTGAYTDFETNKDVRLQFVWDISDYTEADFRYSHSDLEAGSYWYRPAVRLETSNDLLEFPIGNDVNSVAFRTMDSITLKLAHTTDFGTFTSISSYNETEERYGVPYEGRGSNQMGDVDFFNQTFVNRASANLDPADAAVLGTALQGVGSHNFYEIESFSQEFRFTSDDSNRFRYSTGVYALLTDRSDTIRADLTIPGSMPLEARLPNGLPGVTDFATTSGLLFDTSNEQDNTAWAVFFSGDYDITDKLTITAAIRYDEDRREITRIDGPTVNTGGEGVGNSVFGAECTVGVGGCVPRGFVEKETFTSAQPKLSLAYQLTDDILLYGTAARGFRSGGFNASGALLAETFEQEELDSYELGFKSTLMDGRLRVNGAAFFQDYSNAQVFAFDGAIFVQSLYNIPESEITGVEASFDFAATDSLTISGGFGLLDSEITRFDSNIRDKLQSELEARTTNSVKLTPDSQAAFDRNFEGEHLPKFPHTSANISAVHEAQLPLFGGTTLVTGVDYRYTDDRYWWIDNTDVQENISLVNANMTLEFNDRFSAAIWCNNCTDKLYDTAVEPSEMVLFGGPAKDVLYQARERTFGLRFSYIY